MKNQLVASIAVLPLTVAGVMATSSAANAFSSTQFSGGFGIDGLTSVTLTKDALDFNNEPFTPVALTTQEGVFAPFQTAQIQEVVSFSGDIYENPFLDFGTKTPFEVAMGDVGEITDGANVFILENAEYDIKQSGANIAIDVALFGIFDIGGETTKGAGNLTFQQNNMTVDEAWAILNSGGSIDDMALSGAVFTAVPEPATLLGLGLVGAALVGTRRRQNG
ncbi:PEP-CTERM sorting domain-containing protein [Roseofilum sp. Guam]|uniref:PEP-CTERM sorting domain-containing protein n=1 Tax=Roseofilum sp. Guam TaxID=2821502 RepID=UPI001B259EFC|nr:PEP-CTERM sorting domain-containing protein [Roseofilum sp. Guam]MBP0031053.1 PEP-CTERM sorting domain-containing protein [Roseofilum sp. Guam]